MVIPIKSKENLSISESKEIAIEECKKRKIPRNSEISILVDQPEISDLFILTRTYRDKIKVRSCTDEEWNSYFYSTITPKVYKKKKFSNSSIYNKFK